jgi:hypothetical protein
LNGEGATASLCVPDDGNVVTFTINGNGGNQDPWVWFQNADDRFTLCPDSVDEFDLPRAQYSREDGKVIDLSVEITAATTGVISDKVSNGRGG